MNMEDNNYVEFEEAQPEKNNSKTVIIVVAVVVLLCCCCVAVGGGAWLWNNGDAMLNGLAY